MVKQQKINNFYSVSVVNFSVLYRFSLGFFGYRNIVIVNGIKLSPLTE